MDELDEFSWLVGLIEGEGCFSVQKQQQGRYRYPHFNLGSIDEDVIDKAARLLSTNKYQTVTTQAGNTFYTIAFAGKRAAALAILVFKHLSKRRQSQIAAMLTETNPSMLESLIHSGS